MLLKNLSHAIMANLDKLADIIVEKVIKAIMDKISFIIDGILQGYINEDGSCCKLEDIINIKSQKREV